MTDEIVVEDARSNPLLPDADLPDDPSPVTFPFQSPPFGFSRKRTSSQISENRRSSAEVLYLSHPVSPENNPFPQKKSRSVSLIKMKGSSDIEYEFSETFRKGKEHQHQDRKRRNMVQQDTLQEKEKVLFRKRTLWLRELVRKF